MIQATHEFTSMPFPAEREILMRPYFKYELADMYGVSVPTLMTFIAPYAPDFEAIGYHKHLKILTPKMVALLFDKVGKP